MKYITMFSGIDAPSVAWRDLGWQALASSEIKPFPSAVLAHRFPSVPNVGDMLAHDWSQYRGKCDLVVGGPPCQAFSVAGLRGSMSDDRGNLSLSYVRAIHAIDPVWSITENVPGWLSTDDNSFGCVLAGLVGEDAAIVPSGGRWTDCGMASGPLRTAAWRVLDAQYFGVPQRRRRVFVVSVRGSGNWSCAAALFPQRHGLSWDSPPRRETGERSAAVAAIGSYGGGLGSESDVSPCLQASGGADERGVRNPIVATGLRGSFGTFGPDISPALKARDRKGPSSDGDGDGAPLIAHSLRGTGFDASEDGTGRGTPIVTCLTDLRGRGIDLRVNGDIADTLHRAKGQSEQQIVAFQSKQSASAQGPSFDGVAPSLDVAKAGGMATMGASGVRRLTPRECERLQGFDDDHTLVSYRGKPASDGPRYEAIGNSMAVPVLRWIGRRIVEIETP